jgi:cytochrome oxidase Cu insertion factor (SCO1/SenC/PrrC family)
MKLKIFLCFCLLLTLSLAASAQKKPKVGKMPTVKLTTEPLKIGEIAPDFTLSDQNGKQIALSKAKVPVVLVFFRGYW